MAPGQKLYPRATVKKVVKAHANTNLSRNVDVVVGCPLHHGLASPSLTLPPMCF